ncbi:MAG: long-chain fatty acid--CoA ligase [Chrysiogenetes bacterium]|nr:long-chain fatty acid--CoA ligase [Chrysiogenetes bacterium]
MSRLTGQTVPARFLARVEKTPNHPAYWHMQDGKWIQRTWKDLENESARFGAGLQAVGHGSGESVAIMADTVPEWVSCDLGALGIGATVIGVYQTLTPSQAEYVIDHSDATTLIVQGQKYLDTVLEIQSKLPKVKRIISWDDVETAQDDRILLYADVMAKGETALKLDTGHWRKSVKELDPNQCALIIYTSGTTGPPKGAMLSHSNIVFMMETLSQTMDADENDVSFAFLPMAHVAEHVVGNYARIEIGFGGYFARSLETVIDDVAVARPTVFGSVPRIFEKVYAKVQSGLEEAPEGKRKMAQWAIRTGVEAARLEGEGKSVPFMLKLKRAVADKLVLSKIRKLFGGRVKFFISGAAPIALDILEFFQACGMITYEVYGMTESTGLITGNRPESWKLGTVGPIIPDVEVVIAGDGEILTRGKHVFMGYFKNEDATKETIDAEGWLHTGDIGEFDDGGFLRITDRKKNLIITAGGKNVAPSNIENLLKGDPLISQVLVHGDKRNFLSALITLDPDESAAFAQKHGLKPEDVPTSKQAHDHVAKHVEACNADLARYESIKKWEILPEDFTVENEMLTPTMKVKRKQVEEKYRSVLDGFYG